MADNPPQDITYVTRRIWDRGIGTSSRGWQVAEKHPDGKEIPIADFVSHRDARDYVNWKLGIKSTHGE
jgi:hypothetical protein